MSFQRTVWLGLVGAVLALAAVPTTAFASAVVYSDYADWATGSAVPTVEITVLCAAQPTGSNCPGVGKQQVDSPYPQIPNGTGTADQSIPLTLAGSPLVSLTVISEAVGVGGTPASCTGSCPLFRNKVGTASPDNSPYNTAWSSFWPNDVVTNATYGGDVWTTNCVNPAAGGAPCATGGAQTNPVTSLVLTLNSPLNSFGFVALPVDSSQVYDLTATFFKGITSEGSITEQVPNGDTGCTVTASSNTVVGSPIACGFFGYTAGGVTGAGINKITLSIVEDTSQCSQGALGAGGKQTVCDDGLNGGIAIGDFVSGSTVPEPASLAILGVGLVGLGAMRRRRHV